MTEALSAACRPGAVCHCFLIRVRLLVKRRGDLPAANQTRRQEAVGAFRTRVPSANLLRHFHCSVRLPARGLCARLFGRARWLLWRTCQSPGPSGSHDGDEKRRDREEGRPEEQENRKDTSSQSHRCLPLFPLCLRTEIRFTISPDPLRRPTGSRVSLTESRRG